MLGLVVREAAWKSGPRARELRRNMPDAERLMWSHIKNNQLGYRFRRQHPIGPFIADFACVKERVVVELDGPTHDDVSDARRDSYLRSHGWSVFHLDNLQLHEDLDASLTALHAFIKDPT